MARTLFALCLLSAFASAAPAVPLTLGVRGGASVPELRDNGGNEISSGWSSRLAPEFGVFANREISGRLSIQLEANFAAQGGRKDGMQPAPIDPTLLGAPAGTQPAAAPQDFAATTDTRSDLNRVNWGFQAGLGASRALGRGRQSVDVRAGLGLTNIQKDTATNGKNTTGAVLVMLGYGLPVGGR